MWTDDELKEVIRSAPSAVDESLKVIHRDDGTAPVDMSAFTAVARALHSDPAQLCVDYLRANDLVDAFVQAVRARGIELGDDANVSASGRLDLVELSKFTARASTFRCRIEVDHDFKGTGCLVGPGLVLTAWHVVSGHRPGEHDGPVPNVVVRLADGSRHEAVMPPEFESPCGDAEWDERAPKSDSEVASRHDVALLSLQTPAARHLGHAPLPDTAPVLATKAKVFVLDFPEGRDEGLGDGTATKIRNLTARLNHDIPTAPGSSGGACFDREFRLAGVHQAGARVSEAGQIVKRGRFVPLSLFRDEVADFITNDVAPTEIWHLDGDTTQLVIGRDGFVAAVAAAADTKHPAVRGIRVKRRRPAEDTTGLGYSHRILEELLARQGGGHVVVTVPLDAGSPDLLADIAQRVEAVDIRLPAGALDREPAGATLESGSGHRARRLARSIDLAADAAERTVWFFVDHPSVPLTEARRLEGEAFVAECLALPQIRLVVAGLETVPLAGLEFSSPAASDAGGQPGLVVEYIGGVTRADILDCLTRATTDLVGESVSRDIELVLNVLLVDFTPFNDLYADADLPAIVASLQKYFKTLRTSGDADRGRRADPAA